MKRAMVLAAGYGKRMEPLTTLLPKPLLPVCNRPVLERTIEFLQKQGVDRVVINLYHLGDAIRNSLGGRAGSEMEIIYSPEKTLLGTAGGIKAAEAYLGDGTFIVVNGDILFDLDMEPLLRRHREKGAAATLVLREENAEDYGVIKLDEDGRVAGFLSVTSPIAGPPAIDAMFTGVQLLEPLVLESIPPGVPWGTAEQLYPSMLLRGSPVYGYVMSGRWIDMGTPRRYLRANFMLMDEPSFKESVEVDTMENGIMTQGAIIVEKGALLRPPVLLGEGCRLEQGCSVGPYSVLGPSCRIGRGGMVSGSVLWEGAEIGARSRVTGSIVCSGVKIPYSCTIEGEIVVPGPTGLPDTHPIKS